jgi:hypothetical protein
MGRTHNCGVETMFTAVTFSLLYFLQETSGLFSLAHVIISKHKYVYIRLLLLIGSHVGIDINKDASRKGTHHEIKLDLQNYAVIIPIENSCIRYIILTS